jgi:hypothetical protein
MEKGKIRCTHCCHLFDSDETAARRSRLAGRRAT